MIMRAALKTKLQKALLIPTAISLGLTIVGAGVFGWLNYRDILERSHADLRSKAGLVARRITAELLIGPRGAPSTVAATLKEDLHLSDIALETTNLPCEPGVNPLCLTRQGTYAVAVCSLEPTTEQKYVVIRQQLPSFWTSIPLTFLAWAGIPIFLVIGIGTLIQQRQLRRYVTQPLETIIGRTTGGAETPPHWPQEFARLHTELDDAFQKREEAIIGQIASGVIHDLKTLLQPISGASQLASEIGNDGREQRIDLLLRSCQRNLPKMQSILESVLDGSRDIRLQPRLADLATTITSAIRTAKEAVDSGVPVTVKAVFKTQPQPHLHDPIQLERALSNLIKNGIEAAAQAGAANKVLVSVSQTSQRQPEIIIEDTGSGLSAPLETLVASRRSSKARGTGLGLLISKKIIEAHNGTLNSSRSDELRGAKITVTLAAEEHV